MNLSFTSWLIDKIEHHTIFPTITDGWDWKLWLTWALRHKFVYVEGNPPCIGLIARPINREMIYNRSKYKIEDLLCLFDPCGDGVWVDFLWAPGQYNRAIELFKMTGKKWVAWEHRKTRMPHIRMIETMWKA